MQEKTCLVPPLKKRWRKGMKQWRSFLRRPPGSQTCSFFGEGPPPNWGQGEGVKFLEDGQITHQASQPEGEAHISGAGAGAGPRPRLLNQVRTMFHPKVSSSSRKPIKYRYVTSKRELNLSKSKVVFGLEFRPFFCRGRPLAHSRSITILCRKLASSYKRPLGTFGYFRVPYPLYNHTTPRFSSLSHSVCRGRTFDRQITRRANSKAGSPSGFRTRLQHRICQQPVCDPQEGRRTKTSLQPPPVKSIYKVRKFQNGRHSYAQRLTETKRFHGEDRFERSLLYCSNLEKPWKVPQVSLERYSVGVRMPPIWNNKCPQGIYQDSKTSDRSNKEARISSNHLFGRYFTDGLYRRNSVILCHLDGHTSGNVRICGELPKIPTKSYSQ